MAAQNGNETVVQVLLEAGADVNKADDSGVTPLCMAAQNGNETVVRALIEAGADVNKAIKGGRTPLSVSMAPVINVDQGQIAAIVKILRGAGAV